MKGTCENCGTEFKAKLIHNGFNESAYTYCDKCGITGFIDGWRTDIPESAELKAHGKITEKTQSLLAPCKCGGTFRCDSSPRCPNCQSVLSATAAAQWIEEQSPGTEKGWRWQNSWEGLYAIVVNDRAEELRWNKNAL